MRLRHNEESPYPFRIHLVGARDAGGFARCTVTTLVVGLARSLPRCCWAAPPSRAVSVGVVSSTRRGRAAAPFPAATTAPRWGRRAMHLCLAWATAAADAHRRPAKRSDSIAARTVTAAVA